MNDIYLENIYESFFSTKNGFERVTVLKELKEKGFEHEFNYLQGAWYIQRVEYLFEQGVEESELLIDDEGEYRLEINESGAPGADYQVDEKKVYIPKYLNVDYWVA